MSAASARGTHGTVSPRRRRDIPDASSPYCLRSHFKTVGRGFPPPLDRTQGCFGGRQPRRTANLKGSPCALLWCGVLPRGTEETLYLLHRVVDLDVERHFAERSGGLARVAGDAVV